MNMQHEDLNLVGVFALRSPLSHIAESISSDAYLSQEPVMQDDGSVVEVFSYSGNALRGQLRDFMARHFLDVLNLQPALPAFHLLFSGGSIHGDQKLDLARRRVLRAMCPPISLLGGGVGSGMIEGKLAMGIAYPVCQETRRLLEVPPASLQPLFNALPTYGELVAEKSYTRFDDSKDEQKTGRYLAGQKPPDADVQQMRFTTELLAAGAVLVNRMTVTLATPAEIGALVEAFAAFHRCPYLGGQRARGHGLCSFELRDAADAVFLAGGAGGDLVLSADAQRYRDAYAAYLQQLDPKEVMAALDEVGK